MSTAAREVAITNLLVLWEKAFGEVFPYTFRHIIQFSITPPSENEGQFAVYVQTVINPITPRYTSNLTRQEADAIVQLMFEILNIHTT